MAVGRGTVEATVEATVRELVRRRGLDRVVSRRGAGTATLRGVATVVRDRAFLRFAVATAASILLAGETTTVVPLKGFGSVWTTV